MEKVHVTNTLAIRMELLTVYLGIYASALVNTLIFPFANEMILYFGVVSDRNSTGLWVGLLVSALMLGRVVASPIWGWLIDSWGRKPVQQVGLLFISVLCILFGTAESLTSALVFRFLLGALSPLIISSKTILSDLYKGESMNSTMAWVAITWNLGTISGSVFGGILSNPGGKGIISEGIFVQYPYLLANIVPFLVAVIAMIMGFMYLRETLDKDSMQSEGVDRTLFQIATESQVYAILLIQAAIAFASTGFLELIALLSWAEAGSGGLELTTTQIGYLLGTSNLLLLLFQKQLYTYLASVMGNVLVSRYGLLAAPIISVIVPLSGIIQNTYLKFSVLLFLCMVWFFFDFSANTATMVLMNESVHPKELGRLNGINVSISCAIRMVAPVVVGFTFASAIDSGLPQPINYSCGFYLIAIAQCFALIFACRLQNDRDDELNKPASEVEISSEYDEEFN